MRTKLLLQVTLLGTALMLGACASVVAPFEGNDTGGIVAWSPETQEFRHAIAGEHCARYGKLHKITSVHRRYGDYIGFACYWPRGFDPYRVVLERAY
ncbi:MAG: hypothetical protein IRZ09_10325 [Variibacter sp.]|nr:hypothetical protein [Variibacter sp.]